MQDRVPVNPGRVLVTPENGSAAYYATLTRADNPTQEGTPLNKASLLKDATAALFGLGTDAVPDELFSKLSGSAFCSKIPVTIGEFAEGSVIQLEENGVLVDFYVAKHNYESSLNGEGRTLLVRKDCHSQQAWHTSARNTYAVSSIDSWLNGTYKASLSTDVQSAMSTTKFWYTVGNYNNNVQELERSVFLLSMLEYGEQPSGSQPEGTALPVASKIKVAQYNGSAVTHWTRTANTGDNGWAFVILQGGGYYNETVTNQMYVRPAFTLPSNFAYKYIDGIVDVNGETLSIPASQISGGVKVVTGSYAGTGACGSSNPNSLTFDFTPKLLLVSGGISVTAHLEIVRPDVYSDYKEMSAGMYNTVGAIPVSVKCNGTTVSWYHQNDANRQCNSSTTYQYIAIG